MRAALIVVLGVLALGCVHRARLYNLDEASTLVASFKDNGVGSGPIWIGEDRKAATCSGEYSTTAGGGSAWGAIYSSGETAIASVTSVPDSERGQAVIQCKDGRVIECEYVTNTMAPKGHGACRDNKGQRYRLMF